MIGKWPNCRTTEHCPKGTVGKWPHCSEVDRSCQAGQTRKGGRCVADDPEQSDAGSQPPRTFQGSAPVDIPPAIAALTAGRPHRPREILVLVAEAGSDEIAARLMRDYNVVAEPGLPVALLDGVILHLTLVDNRPLESVLAALVTDPDVLFAEPNYEFQASEAAVPAPAPVVPQYAPEKLGLDEAHRVARGNNVTIAIIDTAIDAEHPELKGAIADTFDALGDGPIAAEAHGTAIAGIVAARATLKGVAPEATVLSVRAFRREAQGPARSTSLALIKGIDWAFAAGARVMNMSFAGPDDPLLGRIIKAATDKGAIFVAAAGNGGAKAPPAYPAAYADVIAVTATDDHDQLYAQANHGDYISIAAPGVDIIAPALKGTYELSSGTSMAAAHVSGVAALLLEHHGKLEASDIRAILSSSARKPNGTEGSQELGAGIVDAAGALTQSQ